MKEVVRFKSCLYIFVLAVFCAQCVDGLVCLKCDDVISPRHCHHVETCSENQICMVEQFRSDSGEDLFRIGCHSRNLCRNESTITRASANKKRISDQNVIELQDGAIATSIVCRHCCNDNLCNAEGCGTKGFPGIRGPICFSCDQRRNPSSCNNIAVCADDEECHIELQEEFDETFYMTSCRSSNICKANLRPSLIGRRSYVHCSSCCSRDLCNNNCLNGSTQQPTVTTEATKITVLATSAHTTSPVNNIVSSTSALTTSTVNNIGHEGTEFCFSFPENIPSEIYVELKILIISDTNASLGLITNTNTTRHSVNNVKENVINISRTFEQQGNVIESKAVTVKSNDIVTVYGYSRYGYYYMDISWIPPVNTLDTDYIAASYHPENGYYSFISITAVDSDTSVTITLNMTGTLSYNGKTFQRGAKMNLYLNKYYTFQLSHTQDLTGSRITSNKPISVQSGDTVLHVGIGYDTYSSIFLSPVKKWGKTFIVPPIRTAQRMIIRILPSVSNTFIEITGVHGTKSYHKDVTLELNLPASDMVIVECDKPCFVTQFVVSERYGMVTCYMTLVPAIEQYSRDYHMVSPRDSMRKIYPIKSHFVSIMIKSEDEHGLMLDESTIFSNNADIKSLRASNQTWSVITVPVQEGVHKIDHKLNKIRYGGIAYGFGNVVSYAYALGLDLHKTS